MGNPLEPTPRTAPGAQADSGERIFNNKLLWGYVKFLDARLGEVATDEVLKRIGLDRIELRDFDSFSTNQQSHSITYAAMEITGEKRVPYLVGRDLPKNVGILNGFVAGVTSPNIFMKSAGAIEMRLARKTINETVQVSKNRFRVEITYRDGFMPDAYVCDNRIGCFEAAPLFFGLPYAKVEHPQCVHRGEGNCVYHVEFPEHGFLGWRRTAYAAYLLALGTALPLLLRPSWSVPGALPLGLLIAGLGAQVWYKHLNAKKSLEWSMLANESVLRQNGILDSLNAKLQAMYQVASELTAMTGNADPCGHLARSLVGRMGFGSAHVWLLDPEDQEFRCAGAAGYPEAQRNYVLSARFRLQDGTDNPHGLLIQALERRQTLIVNDIQDVMPRVSPRVREFLEALKITSFIMAPLIAGEKLIGILAGEHHDGEEIGSNDRIIFQSLAQVLTATLGRMGIKPSQGSPP
jgi:hypothetical protein